MNDDIFRIVDANLNRASEGMRVLEETARLVWNDPVLSADLKDLRHAVANVFRNDREMMGRIMRARDSSHDVFREIETESERSRPDLYSLLRANSRRAAEAVRTLEEYGKLAGNDVSVEFKRIRFRLYDLEKRLFERFESMHRLRREALRMVVSVDRPSCVRPAEDCARDMIRRGAGLILYRDTVSRDREFMEILTRVVRSCSPLNVPVLAADRIDAALAAGADGVVLGNSDLPVEAARTFLGDSKLIGRSFSSLDRMIHDSNRSADFILVNMPSGEDVELAVDDVGIPIVCVIDPHRTDGRREKAAGASGFCVFAELMEDGNMGNVMRDIMRILG